MSVLIFWATQVMPGDVAQMIVGQFATDEQIRAVRAKLRLDDPIYVQYLRWAGALLQGDLGLSLMMDRPIGPLIREAILRSAVLAGISIMLVAAIGTLLLGGGGVERQQPGCRGIDGHRRVHALERDAVEQLQHVAEMADRDADLADLAARQRVVRVVPRLGREVEGDREARLALGEVQAVELVARARRAVPGIGAKDPGCIGLGKGHGGLA